MVGKLCPEEEVLWVRDWQNKGQTIYDTVEIIRLLEKKWSVRWETKGIFGAN